MVQEVLSSIRVVKAFAREDYEVRRLEQESLEAVDIRAARADPESQADAAGWDCGRGGNRAGAVVWRASGDDRALTAGSLVVFILYLGKMYKPMQEISKMTDTYSKAAVGYERMQEILDTELDVKDLPKAKRAPNSREKLNSIMSLFLTLPIPRP